MRTAHSDSLSAGCRYDAKGLGRQPSTKLRFHRELRGTEAPTFSTFCIEIDWLYGRTRHYSTGAVRGVTWRIRIRGTAHGASRRPAVTPNDMRQLVAGENLASPSAGYVGKEIVFDELQISMF